MNAYREETAPMIANRKLTRAIMAHLAARPNTQCHAKPLCDPK